MKRFTVSISKELKEELDEMPEINWPEVAKRGLLKRLAELEKFEALKTRGVLESQKFEEFLRELKNKGVI